LRTIYGVTNNMQFLPDCLDEGCGHEAAADEFEDRAAEQADEAAPTCFEGFADLFTTKQFADNSSDEWTEDDTGSAEEQPDKHADSTTPHSPARATKTLGAPRGNDIIEDGDNDGDNAPYE